MVPEALYALYNPTVRKLWVVFSGNLETVGASSGTTFDRSKMFLKVGTHRVYFGSSTTFSLFGIDEAKYALWAMSASPFLKQFTFYSHVLEAELSQADAAILSSATSFETPSIAVSSTGENERIVDDEATVSFVTPNFDVGGESPDNNGIRTRLNGGAYAYHRTRTMTFSPPALVAGINVLEATLVDGNDNPLDNEEAACSLSFVFDEDDVYGNEPMVEVSSPRQGQTISSLPIGVAFEALNHPILPVGSCVQYSVDGGAWVEYRSEDPIQIATLAGGRHTVGVRLADANGDAVAGDGTVATVAFNYGTSADTDIKLLIGAGTIRGFARTETTQTPEKLLTVAVANVYFANLFCPVDLQVIPDETSAVNPGGAPTVLVAKLRSQSSTAFLSPTATATGQILPPASGTEIYGGQYLDGHSVVQYSMAGGVLFSNNASKFADTKANAKSYLGSAYKASPADLMMADSIRRRAIMTTTDLATGEPRVTWEYESDRLVSDFQLAENEGEEIAVLDASCDQPEAYLGAGKVVTWRNSSSMPITIVSGTTDSATFGTDPDLTLYGDEFSSQELQPGEQYARTFSDGGNFHWFSHPNIVTGVVHVSATSTSRSDQYLLVEKDPVPAVGGGRVIKLNSWGKITWSWGDGILYNPKDVRTLSGNSIIIST